MVEAGLGGLHVDALDHQGRGVEPSQVVKAGTGAVSGLGGCRPVALGLLHGGVADTV